MRTAGKQYSLYMIQGLVH